MKLYIELDNTKKIELGINDDRKKFEIEVDISTLTAEQRTALLQCVYSSSGELRPWISSQIQSLTPNGLTSVLDAWIKQEKAQAAKKTAEEKEAIEKIETTVAQFDTPENLAEKIYSSYPTCPRYNLSNVAELRLLREVDNAKLNPQTRQKIESAKKICVARDQAAKKTAEEKAELRKKEMEKKEAARITEKKAWAEKNGSERLKKAIGLGWESEKLYAIERATYELSSFGDVIVDWDNVGEYQARSCPSLEAMTIFEQLKEKKYTVDIVWGCICKCQDTDYCECQKHELILISGLDWASKSVDVFIDNF